MRLKRTLSPPDRTLCLAPNRRFCFHRFLCHFRRTVSVRARKHCLSHDATGAEGRRVSERRVDRTRGRMRRTQTLSSRERDLK